MDGILNSLEIHISGHFNILKAQEYIPKSLAWQRPVACLLICDVE